MPRTAALRVATSLLVATAACGERGRADGATVRDPALRTELLARLQRDQAVRDGAVDTPR